MQTLTNATMATTNSTIELILRHFRAGPIASTSFRRIGFTLRGRRCTTRKEVPSGGTRTPRTLCSRISPKVISDLRRGVGSAAGLQRLAHRNLGEHQWTFALYCFQHHFSSVLPFCAFVFRSRQCLDVIACIAQGAEHTAIRQRDRNMEGARQDISDGP